MSTATLGHVKKVQDDDTLLSQCCRGSGQTMAPAQDCKPPSMPSFQPRAFPPPSLTGVPIEYIVGQLHNFAAQYWDKPETADCTISTCLHQLSLHSSFLTRLPVVPFPHVHSIPELPAFSSLSILEPSYSFGACYGDHTALGRRATQPPLNAVPRISLQVRFSLFKS